MFAHVIKGFLPRSLGKLHLDTELTDDETADDAAPEHCDPAHEPEMLHDSVAGDVVCR